MTQQYQRIEFVELKKLERLRDCSLIGKLFEVEGCLYRFDFEDEGHYDVFGNNIEGRFELYSPEVRYNLEYLLNGIYCDIPCGERKKLPYLPVEGWSLMPVRVQGEMGEYPFYTQYYRLRINNILKPDNTEWKGRLSICAEGCEEGKLSLIEIGKLSMVEKK